VHAHTAADGTQVESEAAVERRSFDKLQRQMGGATGVNGSTVTAAHTSSSTTAANPHSTTGHSGTRTAADKQEPPNIDDYIQQKEVELLIHKYSVCMHGVCMHTVLCITV
jgi:hypothetical protein